MLIASGSFECVVKLTAYGHVVLSVLMPLLLLCELALIVAIHSTVCCFSSPAVEVEAAPSAGASGRGSACWFEWTRCEARRPSSRFCST